MAKQALLVNIDGKFEISVASLPAIAVLKLHAWQDRHWQDRHRKQSKDAYDIGLLIEEYLEINIDRAGNEHQDILEHSNFQTFVAGAIILGRDIKMTLLDNKELLIRCLQIIETELEKNEESLLLNQIIETHPSKKYEEVREAFVNIAAELKN